MALLSLKDCRVVENSLSAASEGTTETITSLVKCAIRETFQVSFLLFMSASPGLDNGGDIPASPADLMSAILTATIVEGTTAEEQSTETKEGVLNFGPSGDLPPCGNNGIIFQRRATCDCVLWV